MATSRPVARSRAIVVRIISACSEDEGPAIVTERACVRFPRRLEQLRQWTGPLGPCMKVLGMVGRLASWGWSSPWPVRHDAYADLPDGADVIGMVGAPATS